MRNENRKLNERLTMRLTPEEKAAALKLLENNSITFQDLMRGYVLNLINEPNNTPIYNKAI